MSAIDKALELIRIREASADKKALDLLGKEGCDVFSRWTQDKKHALRELYSDFLTDTGVTDEQHMEGGALYYGEFCLGMYLEAA